MKWEFSFLYCFLKEVTIKESVWWYSDMFSHYWGIYKFPSFNNEVGDQLIILNLHSITTVIKKKIKLRKIHLL